VARRVEREGGLALFAGDAWHALGERIAERVARGERVDPATILSDLDERLAARITGRLLDDAAPDEETTVRIVTDCLAKLRRDASKRKRRALIPEIRALDARDDRARVAERQREHLESHPERRTDADH
jgi:hypothetical protein